LLFTEPIGLLHVAVYPNTQTCLTISLQASFLIAVTPRTLRQFVTSLI